MFEVYEAQGINRNLLNEIEKFRQKYPVDEKVKNRVLEPETIFWGKEIFEMAATALLEGENILLSGTKATGKNVLAENLAWVF